jgi:hypothetical protein
MTSKADEGASQADGPETEPVDRLFSVLSDPTRRRLLVRLAEANPRTVAAVTPAHEEADEEQVAAELVHLHLPLLEAAGYLEWDRATETIRRGPAFGEVEPCLALLSAHAEALPGAWP